MLVWEDGRGRSWSGRLFQGLGTPTLSFISAPEDLAIHCFSVQRLVSSQGWNWMGVGRGPPSGLGASRTGFAVQVPLGLSA